MSIAGSGGPTSYALVTSCLVRLSGGPMTVARCTIPALAVCLAWLSVSGQAQQPTTPAFDVVSVRPNTSTDGIIDIPPTPPEGVVLHNRSVADVVRYAYQLPSFLVFGLPRWTED